VALFRLITYFTAPKQALGLLTCRRRAESLQPEDEGSNPEDNCDEHNQDRHLEEGGNHCSMLGRNAHERRASSLSKMEIRKIKSWYNSPVCTLQRQSQRSRSLALEPLLPARRGLARTSWYGYHSSMSVHHLWATLGGRFVPLWSALRPSDEHCVHGIIPNHAFPDQHMTCIHKKRFSHSVLQPKSLRPPTKRVPSPDATSPANRAAVDDSGVDFEIDAVKRGNDVAFAVQHGRLASAVWAVSATSPARR
jgi:hypothetical protein